MNKKLLLFMIPILMVSTNVFATDVKKRRYNNKKYSY